MPSVTFQQHSFLKILYNTYYVPGTMLGTGDIMGNKTDKVPASVDLTFWWGKYKRINKTR